MDYACLTCYPTLVLLSSEYALVTVSSFVHTVVPILASVSFHNRIVFLAVSNKAPCRLGLYSVLHMLDVVYFYCTLQ
jgi:hypothetical protein